MRRTWSYLGCALILMGLAGCEQLAAFFGPARTTVRLVNNADFDVEVVLFYGSEQLVPEDVLTATGTRVEVTLSPGEVTSFSRECENLQAIIVDDADLQVIGGGGPDARTEVQRDGTDFNCGDTITFTFDHSVVVVDFDVTVAVTQGS